MTAAWSIAGESASGTFASLDLANLKRTLVSQGVDVVSFDAPGTAFDAAALFNYRELVTIKRNGDNWFKGIVRTIPRMGAPSDERIAYELAGPWWYLEHTVYQQQWNMWNEDKDGGAGLDLLYKSRVVLNQDEEGNAVSVGQQITDALQFAILKGAPISVGTIAPTIQLPYDEQVDVSVAEVITRLMRFLPDHSVYFDYSQSRPQINIVSRTAAPVQAYSVSDGDPAHAIRITAREDLQIPGVICRFEQTHTTDGVSYESTTNQMAGTISDYETLVATIRLGGTRITHLTQEIEVEEIPDPMEDLAWLQGHDPWLKIFAPAEIWIISVTRNGALDLANILTEGQIHDWMDVDYETEEFSIRASVSIRNPNNNKVIRVEEINRKIKVTTTDAVSKTYRTLDTYEGAEAIPEGMAAALYASWGQLQHDGAFVTIEEECSSTVRPGQTLNLAGGLAAWGSMRALIQTVQDEVDTGKTTITFGPAKRIGIDDLVTLLRGFRTRKICTSPTLRTTGLSDDAGNAAALGGAPGVQNVVAAGPGEIKAAVIARRAADHEGETYDRIIQMDPADVSKTDIAVTIKAREIHICVDGVEKAMQIMCSEPYDL